MRLKVGNLFEKSLSSLPDPTGNEEMIQAGCGGFARRRHGTADTPTSAEALQVTPYLITIRFRMYNLV